MEAQNNLESGASSSAQRSDGVNARVAAWHANPAAWNASYSERRRALFQALKGRLIQEMRAAAIPLIAATYEGGGDSGDFAAASTPEGAELPERHIEIAVACYERFGRTQDTTRPVTLGDLAEWVATVAVDMHHGGWENGEGGSGEVTIDAVAAEVRVSHNAYYVESDNYEYTL